MSAMYLNAAVTRLNIFKEEKHYKPQWKHKRKKIYECQYTSKKPGKSLTTLSTVRPKNIKDVCGFHKHVPIKHFQE